MKVAIYARTASREGNPSPAIIQQVEHLRAHVAAQGWELADENVFVDDGYSGGSLDRPGLERLRAGARAGQLDSVWLTALDRLTRSPADLLLLWEELRSVGCQLRFFDEPPGWPLIDLPLLWNEIQDIGREGARRRRSHPRNSH
jgi:site-specific DNA recombinase